VEARMDIKKDKIKKPETVWYCKKRKCCSDCGLCRAI